MYHNAQQNIGPGHFNRGRGSSLDCLVVIGSGGVLESGFCMPTKVEQGSSH